MALLGSQTRSRRVKLLGDDAQKLGLVLRSVAVRRADVHHLEDGRGHGDGDAASGRITAEKTETNKQERQKGTETVGIQDDREGGLLWPMHGGGEAGLGGKGRRGQRADILLLHSVHASCSCRTSFCREQCAGRGCAGCSGAWGQLWEGGGGREGVYM